MTVYAVFEVRVDDEASEEVQANYARYKAAVPEIIARYGGEYLVRAGTASALEGAAPAGRWHIIAFPDEAAAHAYWDSDEYRATAPLRKGAADVRAVLVSPPE